MSANPGFTPELEDAKKEAQEASWADNAKEYYELLSDARTLLLMNNVFFGRLAMKMKFVLTEKVPTAAVRADAVCMFNPHFAKDLDVSERAFVIAHEICHLMYLHFDRIGERDPRLWNHAGDYVINHLLVQAGLKMPDRPDLKMLHDTKYADYSTEQIYEALREEQQQGSSQSQDQSQDSSQGQGSSSGDGDGESQDGEQEQQQGGGGGDEDERSSSQDPSQGGGGDQDQGADPQQQGGGFGKDFGDCDFEKTPSLKERSRQGEGERVMSPREWQDEVVNAAQAAKRQGHLPAGIERWIEDIQEPKLPWQQILARTVSNILRRGSTFRNPSRRTSVVRRRFQQSGSGGNTILPGPKPDRRPIVVALDTSGSMSEEELTESLSEVHQILKIYRRPIRVMACDADVHVDEDIRDVTELPIRGGGGTSTTPVFDRIAEEPGRAGNPSMLVYFSDLMASFPDQAPSYPVVWVQTGGGEPRDVPFGTVVVYDTQEVRHNLEVDENLRDRILAPVEPEVVEEALKPSHQERNRRQAL